MAWYVLQNGQRVGPITEPDLRRQFASGTLGLDTFVWSFGMSEWAPAAALFGDQAPTVHTPAPSAASMLELRPERPQPATADAPPAARPAPAPPPQSIAATAAGLMLAGLAVFVGGGYTYYLHRHWMEFERGTLTLVTLLGALAVIFVALLVLTVLALRVTRGSGTRLLALVPATLAIGGVIFCGSLSPIWMDVAKLRQHSAHARISHDYDHQAIRFEGEIGAGDAYRLQQLLDDNPVVHALIVDSPGGFLDEGYAIAGLVEQRHLSVTVDENCSSACLLPFYAASERYAETNATFGLHSPLSPLASRWSILADSPQKALDAYVHFLGQHGMTEEYISVIEATPSSDLRLFSAATFVENHQARALAMDFRPIALADGEWWALESGYLASPRPVVRAGGRLLRAIRTKFPALVGTYGVRLYHAAHDPDRGDLDRITDEMSQRAYEVSLGSAPQAAIGQFLEADLSVAEGMLNRQEIANCADIVYGGHPAPAVQISDADLARLLNAKATVIEEGLGASASSLPIPPATRTAQLALVRQAFAAVSRSGVTARGLKTQPRDQCLFGISLLRSVRAQPGTLQGPYLRTLVGS